MVIRVAWIGCASALALMGVATPAPVRAQALPPGSWQQSCVMTGINTARGVMTARCGTGEDGPGDDIEEDIRIEEHWNVDFQYSDCGGPIDNRFGRLSCPLDEAKVAARIKAEQQADASAAADAKKAADAAAQAQRDLENAQQVIAATPAMRAAAVIVLGRDLGTDELHKLILTARALTYPESRAAVIDKSLDFGTAAAFLKRYIARSGGEPYRNDAVDLAFNQVYGRASTPAEQVDYYNRISAGKAWYATIVGDLMPSIAPGQQVRAGIAQRVAMAGYGRDPTLDELTQWTHSGQNYGTMMEGVRNNLWSGGNADPLVQTVARALAKLGRPADDAAVKAAIAAWRPMRPTYAQMTSAIGKAKLGNGRPALRS